MNTQDPSHRSPGRRGFTMVELLVVLMVLGILVAVVVGIGNYVVDEQHGTQTRAWQDVVLGAVEKYTQVNNAPPPKLSGTWTGEANYGDNPMWRCRTLYFYLDKEPACMAMLRQLPPNAIGRQVTLAVKTGEFFDSYGKVLDWHPTGGSANTPVLVSAGPDGDFGYNISGTNETANGPFDDDQLKAQKDNIRSDGRTQAP